jgi:preprotein translocase subunit SecG
MKKRLFSLLFLLTTTILSLYAQSDAGSDFMRSTGKLYVVVAAIVAIFLGIVIFLVILERKLTKLENQIQGND